jgi:hypothetical protein
MAGGSEDEEWGRLERLRADTELDAEGILRLLIEAGVDFVVIGGLAVAAHGYVRATKDIDVVPRPTPENREELELMLLGINARPIEQTDVRPEEMPVQWGRGALSPGGNWALQTDHGRIDILQYLPDVDVVETYTELRDQAIEVTIPDVGLVRFASLSHLRLMKRVAGRPQDITDLAELESIHGEAG